MILKWFRQLFGPKTPDNMSAKELDAAFLEAAAKMARKGNAVIYIASFNTLNEALFEKDALPYLLVIKYPKNKGPADLISWFKQYKIGDLK